MFDILVDDQRNYMSDIVCRTAESAFTVIGHLLGDIDTLYLDHDLGEGPHIKTLLPGQHAGDEPSEFEPTGYGICLYLENLPPSLLPKRVCIVSSNPPGIKRMQAALRQSYPFADASGYSFTLTKPEEE